MAKSRKKANPMWGGRFNSGPSDLMERINSSVEFDKNLYAHDIEASLAHAEMLAAKKIINKGDALKIKNGLVRIQKNIESGKFNFKTELEDVHMNIEAALKSIIGETAGRLHTARSRNDQVATDFKLWVRDAIDAIDEDLKELQKALLDKAADNAETIMPGFTHMQTAQPITFGHHLMAYVEMLHRDRGRLRDARKRLNECPLGAAALAGTSFPVDRRKTAKKLGFDCPTSNSIDSVSDRDFAAEFLFCLSLTAVHLSRLAEEIILWVSDGFKFVKLSSAYTTGSSIMPQKRNPDAAELVRGKTGRIFGSLTSILTMLKGLPLAYSKDMQEDKEPVFDAAESASICIKAMAGMVKDMKISSKNMAKAAAKGYSTATDLADWLVQNLGIPFRKSHSITGRIVALAEKKKCRLDELELADMQKIERAITAKVFDVLSLEKSVRSRKSFGGTAPANVKKSIEVARKKL